MSDEELRKQLVKSLSTAQVESVDNKGEAVIEHEADRLLQLIKQHREAYALEENKNGFFAACGVCGVDNLENVESIMKCIEQSFEKS